MPLPIAHIAKLYYLCKKIQYLSAVNYVRYTIDTR